MVNISQDKLYETTIQTIEAVSKFPIIRVEREEFLRKQFSQSPYIDEIIKNGPQSVYSIEFLEKKANEIVKKSTNKTSITSFISGLPGSPITMVASGGADIVQYFGFAINMAQQIAYLFGEEEIFGKDLDEVPEDSKIKIIAYLGLMFGASGSATLISNISKISGQNIAKKVASQALTKTTWYPLVKKTGAIIGQKITKKTVEKTVSKFVPIIGGVFSGGITYITFKPLGQRLINELIKISLGYYNEDAQNKDNLNQQFLAKIKEDEDIIDVDYVEIESEGIAD
ncbi:hypothetical protein [Floricoccus penangensis]|uniref:hypothetical protein n=1 Tax=Floricoccus penangensis TaxID=1859475 RepID=UPI00203EB323|nr:hypothetical protein [Floricoccus penangensis]URZ86522.1 hypothetical protein KIW23_05300 [Floricoccus penangensis]